MKNKNIFLLVITAFLLVTAIVLALFLINTGKDDGIKIQSTDLMENIRGEKMEVTEDLSPYGAAVTDFGLRLFQNSMVPGENSLVSPLSVLGALGMAANGADGETLAQMEQVLGHSHEELNQFLYSFMDMAEELEINRLHIANALWMKDDNKLTVKEKFLKSAASYYRAGIFKGAFDESTKLDINAWVSDHTENMIPRILSEIPEDAVLYLVNALSFEGKWNEIYLDGQVHERTFTTETGQQQTMELMYGDESRYLEDDKATGFMKYYWDWEYAFVALLPNEGVTVAEYVMGLTGEGLYKMLANPEEAYVETGLPKFETASDYELSDGLKAMGMGDAFDVEQADFSRLGSHPEGNLFISRVLHKTCISVTEEGTRAAAATVEELPAGCPPDPKQVYLDRPFLYMIIDSDTCTPIFIGTLMTME